MVRVGTFNILFLHNYCHEKIIRATNALSCFFQKDDKKKTKFRAKNS